MQHASQINQLISEAEQMPSIMTYRPHLQQTIPNTNRFNYHTAFTTTKYLVNDEFAEMLGLQEPVTRKEV